jgi:hypothetical protein
VSEEADPRSEDTRFDIDPREYLKAGLPRPTWAGLFEGRLPERVQVPAGQIPDLSQATADDDSNPSVYTAVDQDGHPVEVAFGRTHYYLTRPARWSFNTKTCVTKTDRAMPLGVLDLTFGEFGQIKRDGVHLKPTIDTATIVTIDLSVLIAGMRPTKFRPDDAIFVSAALAVETAKIQAWYPRTPMPGRGGATWRLTVPVPIDTEVVFVYERLVPHEADNPEMLERVDLLCAATAIVYRSPMYTTKPEAYKGLSKDLKVIKYGETRNPDAQDEVAWQQIVAGRR